MMWQVRALLEDRPGAMAALAAGCGDRAVNILALQIFPAADGRVLDEFVLHTPGGWSAADVRMLFEEAGVAVHGVVACSAKTLEDQPVRYLRAARAVAEEPERLEEQLCRLLDAAPGGPAADLVLDDGPGPTVRLSRRVGFTDTEVARAAQLRGLVGDVLGEDLAAASWEPVDPEAVTLRAGTVEDAQAVVAMHQRCSAGALNRRYHAPVSRISARFARTMLEPGDGLSIVAVVDDRVVGLGMVAALSTGPDMGVLVEDRWQRQGIGARLVHALAGEAGALGVTEIACAVQADNAAVLPTVRRAGLHARVNVTHGLARYRIPVARLGEAVRRRRNRPAMGEVTTPLVALLHGRRELREVYPPADFIDQAVRGGA